MQRSVTSELELLKRLKEKDKAAYTEIYRLYIRRIYAYALSIVKSPVLAEDITHDTFVKLWENANDIHVERSVQAYLYTLTRNHSLNTIRRSSRETRISDEIISNAKARSEDGLQYSERMETGRFINHAVDLLPPQRRLIYELCHEQGYSYQQAAEKLGIKNSTVNSQMVKALKTIRDFMLRNGALLSFLLFNF